MGNDPIFQIVTLELLKVGDDVMSFGLVFWIMMLIWFLFSLWSWWSPMPHGIWVNSLFLFILFLLLGWKVFGAPVHP